MSKRILIVEDQKDDRQIIRDMLAGTGYVITEAEDGEQALAALTKERPDLILMEIQLPSMDGYETMRRIKTDPALLSIPIIAVTSYAPNDARVKRLERRTRWILLDNWGTVIKLAARLLDSGSLDRAEIAAILKR
jgi:CheY-like chemotaxis protein